MPTDLLSGSSHAAIADVSVHRVHRGDVATLEEVFDGLSVASRFSRYHTGTTYLPRGSKAQVQRVDGVNIDALVARHTGGPALGLVWLIRTGRGYAEVAVEVVDAWHGRGLGSKLVKSAEVAAAAMDVEGLRADVLATNRAALRLLQKVAPHATGLRDGPEIVFEWTPAWWARRRRIYRGNSPPPEVMGRSVVRCA